jgi:uncharacterized lipoprotein YajG
MRILWLAAFVLTACQPQEETQNNAASGADTTSVAPQENTQGWHWEVDSANFRAEVAKHEREAQDLSRLTPRQRQAYERGFADCSAGRYDPERGPEAYRLGCAAANDR